MQIFQWEENVMLLALAIIFAVAWLLGFAIFHVASGAIHLLIVLAAVALMVHLLHNKAEAGGVRAGVGGVRGG